MKTIYAAAAVALAFAVPASAMTNAQEMLSAVEKAAVQSFVPGADLTNLSAEQVNQIRSALHNGEDSDQREGVRAAFN